jgi:hypothetical protein
LRCVCILFNDHVIRQIECNRWFWHEQVNIWVDVLSYSWLLGQSFDLVYSNMIIQRDQRDHNWHADSKFIFFMTTFQQIVWFVNEIRLKKIILNELKFRLKFSIQNSD